MIRRQLIIVLVISMFLLNGAFAQGFRDAMDIDFSKGAIETFNSSSYQSNIRSGKSLGVLAKEVSPISEEAASYGFAAKSDEAKFFIIGTLYSEALAYLSSGDVDSTVSSLETLSNELINLGAPSSIYNLVSKLIYAQKAKKYTPEISLDVLSMFQPFIEEYAEALSQDKLTLFRAGSWFMDLSLAASAGDNNMLIFPHRLDYFIAEMKRMDAPKGALKALNDIADISNKKDLTDKDAKKILRLIKKIQVLLG